MDWLWTIQARERLNINFLQKINNIYFDIYVINLINYIIVVIINVIEYDIIIIKYNIILIWILKLRDKR